MLRAHICSSVKFAAVLVLIVHPTKNHNMKKIILITMLAVGITSLTTQQASAQAWNESSKVITLGLGGSYHHSFLPGYYVEDGEGSLYNGRAWGGLKGSLLLQGEFGVHKYVGVGFVTGFTGSAATARRGYLGYSRFSTSTNSFNFIAGAQANFHFYQLIADKVSKDIHADKLDIYAGANLGTGVGYNFSADNIEVPVWGGLHFGARYYFTEKIGVYLEVAPYTGKSFISGGVAFNL